MCGVWILLGTQAIKLKDCVCKCKVDICTGSIFLFPFTVRQSDLKFCMIIDKRSHVFTLMAWEVKHNSLLMLVKRYDAFRTVYGWLARIPPSPWLAVVSQSHASDLLLPQWNSPKKVKVSTSEMLSKIPVSHCTSFACLLSHTVANCSMLS